MFKFLSKIRVKKIINLRVSSFEFRVSKKGFTLAELLISSTIFGILIMSAFSIYTNFYNSYRNLRAANLIYEEARFTMERIAKEIRNGTIDYEEYYNQATNFGGSEVSVNDIYGQNYCQYSRQFYAAGPDNQFGTYDDESLGVRKEGSNAPLGNLIQNQLFLINGAGDQRTFIKLIKTTKGLGKIGMIKLDGKDYGLDHINADTGGLSCMRDSGEKDGLIDTWFCEKGFKCPPGVTDKTVSVGLCTGPVDTIMDNPSDLSESSFLDITPQTLDVEDIKFFITPSDDPYKAYNDPSVQIQPNVTIKLTARAGPEISGEFTGKVPEIVIESTVSSRTYKEIITACNLQECIDGDKRECPKKPCPTTGSCEAAEVECSQGVWPICDDAVYLEHVNSTYEYSSGVFTEPGLPPDSKTYYESDNEIGSCNSVFSNIDDINNCKNERCSDGFDNDGNGLADDNDPACVWIICDNGMFDNLVEDCLDVGGQCYWRPLEINGEISCTDGYDNDCDGLADQFDPDCIAKLCSNWVRDPIGEHKFLRNNYQPPNYLLGASPTDYDTSLNEKCKDIGGICETECIEIQGGSSTCTDPIAYSTVGDQQIPKTLQASETGVYCYDGLDNDCNGKAGKADELDPSCKDTICKNGQLDDKLVNSGYTPADYLVGYTDENWEFYKTNLDEKCIDTGGLCGNFSAENTVAACTDFPPVDNDCNGKINQDDPGCCPDNDSDNFSPINPPSGTDKGKMCSPPVASETGYAYGKIDCDDNDPTIRPYDPVVGSPTYNEQTPEACDNATYTSGPLSGQPIDNNCSYANGLTTGSWDSNDPACCIDLDGDGYGISIAGIYNNTETGECRFSSAQHLYDCDDIPPAGTSINPGATEICDGIDNNCDGQIDENPITKIVPWIQFCYTGPTGTQGVGICKAGTQTCQGEGGWGAATCAGEVLPTAEICDGLDNDCDGQVDEGVKNTYYADTDGDGYGDPNKSVQACSAPSGYVLGNTDCNDNNWSVHAGTLTTYYADKDGDGYGNPSSPKQDCSPSAPTGYVSNNKDCDDTNAAINPDATELCPDGIDNDCDGFINEGCISPLPKIPPPSPLPLPSPTL